VRTIAVDWSGRKQGAARHIWAAEVAAGELVSLSNGRTGPQLAGWLVDQASEGEELAVGLDFAFSVPAWYLRILGVAGAPELWEAAAVDGQSWLSACQAPFWGRKGAGKPIGQEHFRRTELETPPVGPGAIRPKSVFQIGGAGAVGTGSIRGMALLARLRREGFAVWPFDETGWPRVVEIYPRLLTGPVTKSLQPARAGYLARLGWPADAALRERAASTEDAFDAALSALGMHEHQEDLAAPPPVPEIAALEGWIWCPRTTPELPKCGGKSLPHIGRISSTPPCGPVPEGGTDVCC
jgi:hypothetical protein